MRNPLAGMIYAGILVFWVLWSILEAGLDFVALLPRLAAWLVVGLWFLTPWYGVAMGKTKETPKATNGRWVGFASLAGALLLVAGALQGYSVVEGTKNAVAAGTAVTDWRNYGGVSEGQRFAQIDQINVENVGQLKQAWRGPHGRRLRLQADPADGQWHALHLHRRVDTLMALDADTGARSGNTTPRPTCRAGWRTARRLPGRAAALAIMRRRRLMSGSAPSAFLPARRTRACWRLMR